MCRNIRTLFNFEPPVSEDEIRAAALQFVRKVSGFTKPSKANEEAFLAAYESIAIALASHLREIGTFNPRPARARVAAAAPKSAKSARKPAARKPAARKPAGKVKKGRAGRRR